MRRDAAVVIVVGHFWERIISFSEVFVDFFVDLSSVTERFVEMSVSRVFWWTDFFKHS